MQSQEIVCYEEGSDQPPWSGRTSDLTKDLAHLLRLSKEGVIAVMVNGSAVAISGVDKVGLIVLPSGRRLIIRSKITNLVLVEWLSYLNEFPALETWLQEAGVSVGNDFHECLARLFLYELEKVTRLHLRKDYMPVASHTPTIRGRIVMNQLCRRLHRLPSVPQQHRLRTLDTTYNVVLAMTLDKLPILLSGAGQDDRKLLAALRESWAQISRDITDPVSAICESQWACPPGYVAALQLARLILMGVALESQSRMGGQAFTLSLSLIWERGLRRMFDAVGADTGWISVPDSARTRRWDDWAGGTDPARWLTADVIGERGNLRWVLDAKYKRDFGNESRSDRFQMCAYSIAFDADVVSLVYPTATKTSPTKRRPLLHATVGSKRVVIESFELPMAAGPKACIAALEALSIHDDRMCAAEA
jgi:5-methylcytosine-specific restriction endonuclease McrBC regulatory subunit McrC